MMMPAWYVRMNSRERILSLSVAGVVFLLVNLFLWSWLLGSVKSSREDLAKRKLMRREQEVFVKERDLWTQREEWLQKNQPPFGGAGEASTLLEQKLKPVATKHNILLENPQIGSGETTPSHQTVWAQIETKSDWASLVRFLYDVQQPDAFIVFESANIAVDSGDATRMKGKFKIARWFAPATRKKG